MRETSKARDVAWEDLFESAYERLLRFAQFLADDGSEAEELVQEAFVRVYQRWERLEDHSAAEGYLRVTVLNLARGRVRRRIIARRHRAVSDEYAPSAERQVLAREGDRAIVDAIRLLPRRQRECVVLRYYTDLSVDETARTLEISQGSVKAYTHRALETLSQILKSEEPV